MRDAREAIETVEHRRIVCLWLTSGGRHITLLHRAFATLAIATTFAYLNYDVSVGCAEEVFAPIDE